VAQNSALLLAETVADVAAVLVVGAILIPPLRRLRQPQVIAEIIAGIVLGPSLLGLFPGHLTTRFFPLAVRPGLSAIAQVGILLFMFLVGWEMDAGQIRSRGTAVFGISLSSIALPFGTGIALATWLYHDHATVNHHHVSELPFVLFVGTAMAITAFPVLARIILEHRLQMTPVGTLALASAAVGDVLAWCMLALVSMVAVAGGTGHLWSVLGYSALYAVVLGVVVRPLLRILIDRMTKRDNVSPQLMAIIAAGVFTAGYVTNQIGLDAIFGAFSFGMIMPRDSRKRLEAPVRIPMEHVTALLMPIFFISTGLTVDVTKLGSSGLLELVGIIGVACLGKLTGATGAARLTGMSWSDSVTMGLLMNTRGLTELIILNAGVSMGVLDTRMFTMMVLMALVTTGMAGPLVPRRAYARSEQFATDGALLEPTA
jgi:Kef-type K+ transport system membrane component KefB